MNGFITGAQLNEALSKQGGRPLGETLVELRFITSGQLAELLAQQREADAPSPDGTLRRVGPYALTAKLGSGGAGTVWKAWDTQLQRWVAIKEPHGPSRERFLREARAAAKLRHPNLIEAIEVLTEEGQDYLVMNFVDGRPLDAVEPRCAADAVATLCGAVQHMHDHGLVHRDIKPQNILVDTAGVAHLGDFGLAKDADAATLTAEGAVLGTPTYMAPEQVAGTPASAATDVYGLGATLYHAVAGRPPFDGEIPAILQKVLSADPPPIPGALGAIIGKAMSKSPSDRYATAAALGADLRRFLAGEPVEAKPVSAAAKWLRANRRLLTISLIAALIVVAWLRVTQSQDRYQAAMDDANELWSRATKGAPTAEQAYAKFVEAATLDERRPEPCVMAARCLALLGRDGEGALNEALKRHPLNGPALLERSKLFAQRYLGGRVRPATRVASSRVRFGAPPPESPEERAWREKSQSDLLRARVQKGLEPAELAYIDAAIAFGEGRFDKAAAIEPSSWDAAWLALHGLACLYAGDFARAERSLTASLALQAKPWIHRARGDVRFCAGKFAEAVADYDAAGDAVALCNRGIALTALGRTSEAVDSITKAIERQPSFPRAYLARGIALAEQAEFAKAQKDFETALEQDERYAEAYDALGNVLVYQGKTADAIHQYGLAIDMNPSVAEPRVHRGMARRALNQLAEAVADFDEALKIDETADTLAELGITLKQLGDARAGGVLKRALEIAPSNWPRRGKIESLLQ